MAHGVGNAALGARRAYEADGVGVGVERTRRADVAQRVGARWACAAHEPDRARR